MSYISSATTIAYVDVRSNSKTVFLPSTFNIAGKLVTVKDIFGSSGSNTITIATVGGDIFENGSSTQQINEQFGATQFVAQRGVWYSLNTFGGQVAPGVSSLSSIVSYGLSTLRTAPGISSLSSIVSYGLSSLRTAPGISSLSSIVSYGLSTLRTDPGISSLSSIVSYGLSTLRTDPGISSLSSIVSYGLSSLIIAPGISSLSSIVSYGLSSLRADPGISSLSSIVSYGLSSLITDPGISSLSSIVSYGISSLITSPGISSLSSIVSYGLSSLRTDPGISSLSSIVSYGLSSLGGQASLGISSLSSIVSYGLSSLIIAPGISSLSSIVSYGLSTLRTDPGISSLSSIISYGLSSLGGQVARGISSLSSIVSYGLSSLITAPGISSLSSIISYGLSSLRADPGISSLSSIVSYGLSSLGGQAAPGISSLSSIVSYGLSSLITAPGISTLSSILSYGLSSIDIGSGLSSFSTSIGSTFRTNTLYVFSNVGVRCNTPAYPLDVNGSIQGKLASNSIGNFSGASLGGAGILDAKCNAPDTYVDSIYKLDSWIFNNIITKPPPPTGLTATATKSNISVSWTNPVLYSIGLFNTFVPNITTLFVNISNAANTVNQSIVLSNQSNLPMYPFAVQGADFYNVGTFNNNIVNNSGIYYIRQTNTNITFPNGPYNITVYFSNHNVTPQIPINFVTALDLNLLTVGAPSAPRNVNITSSTPISITFSWLLPEFSDSTDNTTTIAFLNYRLISSNTTLTGGGYPRRYPGNLYDTNPAVTNTISFSGGTQTFTVSGLFPDNPYSGRIAARNVINTNYGIFSNYFTSFRTALPTEPARLTGTTLPISAMTPNQGIYAYPLLSIRAGTRNNIALTVYSLASISGQGGFKFSFPGLAIHSAQTPGVSNVDISRIIASNSSGATAFFSNSGFLDTSSYQVTQNNITIERNNVQDFYNGVVGYFGFYQIANYIVSFDQSLFSASQNLVPLFVSQSNLSNASETQTNSFYIDNLTAAISVNLLSNNGVIPVPTNYITGVASHGVGNTLNTYIQFSNIGNNFLVHPTFGQYSLRVGATAASAVTVLDSRYIAVTPIYFTSDAEYTNGILPNPARIRAATTITAGTAFTSASADLQMNIRGCNIVNSTVDVNCNVLYHHPSLGALKLYVDLPSLTVMGSGGVGTVNGVRVRSGFETINPTNYGGTFDHTSNLATTYSNELQMVNGIYVTKAASPTDAYRNYSSYYGNNSIDYSGIANNSIVRFVTFKYTANRGGGATGTIGVRFDYTNGLQFNLGGDGLFSSGILLQYKIDSYLNNDGTSSGSANSTPTSANLTTVWLNGNAVIQSGFATNSYTTPNIGGLDTSKPNNVIDRYLTIRQGNYNNLDLYIRIGIPMNVANSFRGVSILNYT